MNYEWPLAQKAGSFIFKIRNLCISASVAERPVVQRAG